MTMDSSTPGSTPGSTPPPTWTPDASAVPPAAPVPPADPLAASQPVGFVPPPPVAPAGPAPFAPPPTSFAPAPIVAKTTARNRASTGTALLLVGALVAIGGVAFAVGRVTAPTAAAPTNAGGFGGAGRGNGAEGGFGGAGGFGGGFGGGAARGAAGVSISGTVVSIDGSSIQIKLANGTTETLNLASTVTYRDSTTGTAADVTPGATVEISLALGGGGGPTASGQPRPSGGFGGLGNATVGTITVVK